MRVVLVVVIWMSSADPPGPWTTNHDVIRGTQEPRAGPRCPLLTDTIANGTSWDIDFVAHKYSKLHLLTTHRHYEVFFDCSSSLPEVTKTTVK